jgi:hypothetical protein
MPIGNPVKIAGQKKSDRNHAAYKYKYKGKPGNADKSLPWRPHEFVSRR